MDFLTQLSIRYTEKAQVLDEEDPEDSGNIFYHISYHVYVILLYTVGILFITQILYLIPG